CQLVAGKVYVLAVEALGLVYRWKAEEGDDVGRIASKGDRLVGQGFVLVGIAEAETGGEGHCYALTYRRPYRVARCVDPRRVDLRAASTLKTGSAGELSDHGHHIAIERLQRQYTVVLQQYGTLGCRGFGELVVPISINGRRRRPLGLGRPAEEFQNP